MTTSGVLSQNALTFYNTGVIYAELQATAANHFTLNGALGGTTVLVSQATDPVAAQDVATKNYVDNAIQGLTWKQAADFGTSTTDTYTVTATSSTLTNNGTQTAFTIDGGTPGVGARVLIKNGASNSPASTTQNGVYVVTNAGSGSTNWVLTRSTDCAFGSEAAGVALFITNGTMNADTAWVCNTPFPATFGQAITFVQFSSGGGSAAGPTNSIQINANGTGSFAGYSDFSFNQDINSPILSIGSDSTSSSATINLGTGTAQTNATINLGQGSTTSTIAGQGTGLMTISSAGAFTASALNTANVQLFNSTTSGTIALGTSLTSGSSLTLGNSGGSGSLFLNGSTGTVLTSFGNFSSTAPVGSTIQLFNSTTTGAVSLATAGTNILTLGNTTGTGSLVFNGTTATTLTSTGPFTAISLVTSPVALFNTQTTGAISLGTSLTNASSLTLGNTSGSGSLVFSGSSGTVLTSVNSFSAVAGVNSPVTLFNTTTGGNITTGTGLTSGNYTIGNASMTGTITLNNMATINIGNGNSTTINIGGTSTVANSILATGASGTVEITAGAGTAATAGAVSITSGSGVGTFDAGAIDLFAGNAGATSGTGGSINLTAGAALGTAGVGGSTILTAGAGTTTNGNVELVTASFGTASAGTLTTGIVGFYDSTLALKAHMEDDGSFYSNGTFNSVSDVLHKKNIEPLNDSLAKIKQINGYSYNWKESFSSNKRQQYGVIAQDLEKVDGLTILVNGCKEGTKTVNYTGLIPVLIEAIKELSDKVDKYEKLLEIDETDKVDEEPKQVRRHFKRKKINSASN